MTASKNALAGFAVIVGLGLSMAVPAGAQTPLTNDTGLASASLADGHTQKAIQMLEAEIKMYPNDPALRINLGIAYAQAGSENEARLQFEAAMASRDTLELDTADGRTTDSRKLARQAIAMLERGDFRSAPAQAEQLTLRD